MADQIVPQMNILHIANFGRSGPGGIRTVVEELSRCQRELGAHVCVGLTLRHDICDEDNMFRHCPDLKSFRKLTSIKHPDIVVFHGLFNKTFYLFSRYCRIKRIPYGIVMHGAGTPASMKDRAKKKKVALFLFVNRFVRQASALFFLCEGELRKNILASKNKNHYIIPNGVDKLHPSENKMPHERVRFLFLGRIVYYEKAIDILLQVFEILKKRGADSLLEFAFYGPRYSDKLLLDIEPYTSFVSWHGPVYCEEKFSIFSDSDVFVLVSRSEGMPMGVIEALSCGTPCIITPETNMSDLIIDGNAGWITSLDPEDIANSMISAVTDCRSRYPELSQNALNSVSGYTWNSIAKRSILTYQDIISRGKC